jgi:hypothetical protein
MQYGVPDGSPINSGKILHIDQPGCENARNRQKADRMLANVAFVLKFILDPAREREYGNDFTGIRLTKMMQAITVLFPASHIWGVFIPCRCFT